MSRAKTNLVCFAGLGLAVFVMANWLAGPLGGELADWVALSLGLLAMGILELPR